MSPLNEGEDYEILPDGRLVFTATFLLKRGLCCGSGCRNCPFDYENVAEPKRSRCQEARQSRALRAAGKEQ